MFRRIKLVAAALMALSATFIGSGAGIAATPTPDYEAIDQYVSRSLAGAPGVALAIVHGDESGGQRDRGVLDHDHLEPVVQGRAAQYSLGGRGLLRRRVRREAECDRAVQRDDETATHRSP